MNLPNTNRFSIPDSPPDTLPIGVKSVFVATVNPQIANQPFELQTLSVIRLPTQP